MIAASNIVQFVVMAPFLFPALSIQRSSAPKLAHRVLHEQVLAFLNGVFLVFHMYRIPVRRHYQH